MWVCSSKLLATNIYMYILLLFLGRLLTMFRINPQKQINIQVRQQLKIEGRSAMSLASFYDHYLTCTMGFGQTYADSFIDIFSIADMIHKLCKYVVLLFLSSLTCCLKLLSNKLCMSTHLTSSSYNNLLQGRLYPPRMGRFGAPLRDPYRAQACPDGPRQGAALARGF